MRGKWKPSALPFDRVLLDLLVPLLAITLSSVIELLRGKLKSHP